MAPSGRISQRSATPGTSRPWPSKRVSASMTWPSTRVLTWSVALLESSWGGSWGKDHANDPALEVHGVIRRAG